MESSSKLKINKKTYILVSVFISLILVFKVLGIFEYINFNNMHKLKEIIESFGMLGPIVYIVSFVIGCMLFIPAPPMAMVAGLAFGPLMGSVWTCVGALISDGLSFLLARYTMRNTVEAWINKNKNLKKIDEGVRVYGWRLLVLTRLVPGLPYILQSYTYGLTDIKFSSYILVSWICTIPGIIAFVAMGGCVAVAGISIEKVFVCIGVLAVIIVILSLLPKVIKKRINI